MAKKIKTGLLIVAFMGTIIMILFVDYSVRVFRSVEQPKTIRNIQT